MTWIISTLWPASASKEVVKKLYQAGVDVFRFNFAHETSESAQARVDIIREIEEELGKNIRIMADIKGPGIRTWMVAAPISYHTGEKFKIFTNQYQNDIKSLFCDYLALSAKESEGWVRKWWIIKIDGIMDAKVIEKGKDYVEVEALNDYVVGSRRHINLPKVNVKLPNLTEKDKEDILFAISAGFDYIALSFARTGAAIQELRDFLDAHGGKKIKIISKIENEEWLKNIKPIADKSDMVMVARGDLGTELPIQEIPLHQRNIIQVTKKKHKKAIVATEMMESMIHNPTPTRAEVNDVYMAVIEDADYVMLSGETAMGEHPVACVEKMEDIIKEAKKTYKKLGKRFI